MEVTKSPLTFAILTHAKRQKECRGFIVPLLYWKFKQYFTITFYSTTPKGTIAYAILCKSIIAYAKLWFVLMFSTFRESSQSPALHSRSLPRKEMVLMCVKAWLSSEAEQAYPPDTTQSQTVALYTYSTAIATELHNKLKDQRSDSFMETMECLKISNKFFAFQSP